MIDTDGIKKRTLKILKVDEVEVERGLDLHRKSLVFDSLLATDPLIFSGKLTQEIVEMVDGGVSLGEIYRSKIDRLRVDEIVKDLDVREEYMEAWRTSGVTCASQTLPRTGNYTIPDLVKNISIHNYKIEELGGFLLNAKCAEDIKRAKKEGKHAILYNVQNIPHCIYGANVENELDNIDTLFGLGVKVLQLTYQLRNVVGDGNAERYESGLSRFGIRVIERMNKIGMLIDTSHCGYQTTLDAAETSMEAVAATHTTCKALHGHPRGKTDEELQAIAEKGGYVGICMIPQFIGGSGTIKEWLDHVEYVVNLIGVDHVGIGSDTGYEPQPEQVTIKIEQQSELRKRGLADWWNGFWPIDMEFGPEMNKDETQSGSLAWINWPYFTVGLVSRGYSDKEIKKILGENFLKIIEKVVG